jgi:hypothetical protein
VKVESGTATMLLSRVYHGDGSRARASQASEESTQHGGAVIRQGGIAGFIDGLTVPVALTIGLSFLNDQKLILTASLTALVAGTTATMLQSLLTTSMECKRYNAERSATRKRVLAAVTGEGRSLGEVGGVEMVQEVLGRYGVGRGACKSVVDDLSCDEESWVQVSRDWLLVVVPCRTVRLM